MEVLSGGVYRRPPAWIGGSSQKVIGAPPADLLTEEEYEEYNQDLWGGHVVQFSDQPWACAQDPALD